MVARERCVCSEFVVSTLRSRSNTPDFTSALPPSVRLGVPRAHTRAHTLRCVCAKTVSERACLETPSILPGT